MNLTDISGVTQKGKPGAKGIRQHTIYDRWGHEEMLFAAAGGPSTHTLSRPVTEEEKKLVQKLVAAFEAQH